MPNDLGVVLQAGKSRQVRFVRDEGDTGAFGGLHIYLAVADEESLFRFDIKVIQQFEERFRVGLRVSDL